MQTYQPNSISTCSEVFSNDTFEIITDRHRRIFEFSLRTFGNDRLTWSENSNCEILQLQCALTKSSNSAPDRSIETDCRRLQLT